MQSQTPSKFSKTQIIKYASIAFGILIIVIIIIRISLRKSDGDNDVSNTQKAEVKVTNDESSWFDWGWGEEDEGDSVEDSSTRAVASTSLASSAPSVALSTPTVPTAPTSVTKESTMLIPEDDIQSDPETDPESEPESEQEQKTTDSTTDGPSERADSQLLDAFQEEIDTKTSELDRLYKNKNDYAAKAMAHYSRRKTTSDESQIAMDKKKETARNWAERTNTEYIKEINSTLDKYETRMGDDTYLQEANGMVADFITHVKQLKSDLMQTWDGSDDEGFHNYERHPHEQRDSYSFGYLGIANPNYWNSPTVSRNEYDNELTRNWYRYDLNCLR